jgi:hypothetical protein
MKPPKQSKADILRAFREQNAARPVKKTAKKKKPSRK